MEHKIKLLHIITNLERGGAQKVLYDLIAGLDKKAYEHHVIYFRYGPYVKKLEALGIPVYHVQGVVSLYDPFFFIQLYRQIKKLRPNTIHSLLWAANVSGRFVAWLLGIPIATVYHNNVFQDGKIRMFFDVITQKCFGSVIVAVSNDIKKGLEKREKNQNHAIEVIINGIDVHNTLKRVQEEKKLKQNIWTSDQKSVVNWNDYFVIGSVGRFVPVKNYPLLIESFSLVLQEYKQVRLMLVGSGPEEKALKTLAMQKNIADKIIFIVGESAYGYYSLFDCFVQSSDKEGISMALLEALSLGIPSIVTDKDGQHPVIIDDYNGLLVPAGDAQQLAQALIRIIKSKNVQQHYGLAGKKSVMNSFNSQCMIKRYHTLFKGMISSVY